MFQRCFTAVLVLISIGHVGKLSLATKLSVSKDGKTVELENSDAQVIALNDVRRKGR